MKKNTFLYSTLIMVFVNFIVRFLGFFYKIILSRIIGPQGLGLFHLVFPVLMICITFTTAGLPIAVSKLVAHHISLGNKKDGYKTLKICTYMGLLISIFFSILIIIKAKYISYDLLKSPDSYLCVIAISPAIIIITLSSMFRGYYYGIKDVSPAGTSQILEQLSKVVFVIGGLYILKPTSIEYSALIAIIGISIGEFTGFSWLFFTYLKDKKTSFKAQSSNSLYLLKDISIIALPITLTRLVGVVMQSLNSVLIPQKLQLAGYSYSEAMKIFGKVTGMAFPLLFMPFIVTSALVVNIIPSVSQQMAIKNIHNIKQKTQLAFKMTFLVSIPLALLFLTFSQPLCILIYNQGDVAFYLSFLSFSVFLLSLHHTSSGILHGMGKQTITTINYLIGISFQLFCTFYLVPNPAYGIKGFLYGFLISISIIATLNFISLNFFIKKMPFHIFNDIVKPLFCSLLMIFCIRYSYHMLELSFALKTLSSLLIGMVVYIFAIFFSGCIKLSTIEYIISKK